MVIRQDTRLESMCMEIISLLLRRRIVGIGLDLRISLMIYLQQYRNSASDSS